jgi:hypothetical protein
MANKLLIVSCVFLFVTISLLIAFLPIRWRGHKKLPGYRLAYSVYNQYTKKKHEWFHQALNIDVCMDNIRIVKKVFEEANITKWWMSEGSALGIKREGGLIKWDDDVDITVDYIHFDTFLSQVYKKLIAHGFLHVLNERRFPLICFIRNGEKVDIGFYSETFKVCSEGMMSGQQLAPHLSKIAIVETKTGMKLPIPAEDSYYVALYGPNWKTPNRKSKSNQNDLTPA